MQKSASYVELYNVVLFFLLRSLILFIYNYGLLICDFNDCHPFTMFTFHLLHPLIDSAAGGLPAQ